MFFASIATLGLTLVLGAGGVAEHWQLSYTLGSGVAHCPSEDEIRQSISARLGHDPFAPNASSRVSLAVELVGRELRGRVLLERGPEERVREQQFTAAPNECRELASAMALSVSIAIDPLSLIRPGSPEAQGVPKGTVPTGTLPPLPALPPPAASPTAAAKGKPSGDRLVWRLVLGAELSVLVQPEVGVGAFLGFEAQWRRLVIGLEADVLAPATGQFEPPGPVEIQTYLIGGKLLPCADLGLLDACAVLWVASEHAAGVPPDPAFPPGWKPMIAVGGRAFRDLALSERFFARGLVDILVPVYSTPYQLKAGMNLTKPEWPRPPLNLTFGLGLGWRLP